MAKKIDDATYVDGFLLVVPKDKLKVYRKMAAEAGKVWRRHGALDYKECVGDDMNPEMGNADEMGQQKLATFPDTVKLKDGEMVVFSYITFKSKKHRNEVNKKVMKEFMASKDEYKNSPMPFDMKRMAYGGFKVIVSE